MFHRADSGGFLVCCEIAIQQLNGVEKNYVAISLMLNHDWTMRPPTIIPCHIFRTYYTVMTVRSGNLT